MCPAYDYALALKDHASRIDILQRSNMSTALPLLKNRVEESSNIAIHKSVNITRLGVSNSQIKIFGSKSEKSLVYSYDIVLIAIGRRPNIDFFSPNLKEIFFFKKEMKMHVYNASQLEDVSEQSNLNTKNADIPRISNGLTKIARKLWFIGDMINENFRQISIALGDGVRTAMELDSLLRKIIINYSEKK